MDRHECREWINTGVAILVLAVLILGFLFGVNEIKELNLNLKDIRTETVYAKNIQLVLENGSLGGCLGSTANGTFIGGSECNT